jgi:hypothetical protein
LDAKKIDAKKHAHSENKHEGSNHGQNDGMLIAGFPKTEKGKERAKKKQRA